MAMLLLLAYLIALLIRPQDWYEPVEGFPTGLTILPLALLIGLLTYLQRRQEFRIPQNRLLPLYLLVTFISTVLETDVSTATEWTVLFATRAAVFFIVVWLATSTKRLQWIVAIYLFLISVLAYQAIQLATTGTGWGGLTPEPGYTEIRVRWHGDWDGPNVFAILFLIGMGFALELVFGPYKLPARFIGVCASALYLTAIALTNSRGAILALAAMLTYYFKDRFNKTTAILLAPIAVVALFAFGPSRLDQLNSGESSAHERTWLWEQGLAFLIEEPILGVGRGQFARLVDLRLIAHNNYVQNFSELGLTGFFLFLSLLWFSYKGAKLTTEQSTPQNWQLASLGRMATTSIVGYCAATFFVVMELDLLYFLLGFSSAIYVVGRRESPIPSLSFSRKDAAIVCIAAAVLISTIWVVAVLGIL